MWFFPPFINVNQSWVHICPPILNIPPTSLPTPSLWVVPEQPALSALLHALNLHWSSILHMVIYMFRRYSLKSSHSHLFPQSKNVCSLLCLFCCLAYKVVITVFLKSIYMYQYTVFVFLFLTYLTLYNRHQFHPPHQN